MPEDGTDERRERFAVDIGRPKGVRIGDGSAVARIRDIDPRPRIRGVDATVTEPTDAPETVDVRFRLSHVSGRPIRVVVATQPGTADYADFTPILSSAVIPPGQASVVVPIDVLPDAVEEGEEQLTVRVVRGRHVRIGRPATVTITPPPAPPPVPRGPARHSPFA